MTSLWFRAPRKELSSGALQGICFFVGLTLSLFLFLGFTAAPARATINYELSLEHPEQHLFRVTMVVPEVHGDLTVQLPAWNALYEIRDFSSRVQRLTAESDGKPLAVEKLDKLTWRTHADSTVTIRYAIFWDSPGPFASQLNETHAFINPAMVFLYDPTRLLEGISLALHDVPKDWEVDTPLDHTKTQSGAIALHTISATRYDAFADGPIEIGAFRVLQITDGPNPVFVAVHGDNWKQSEVEDTLRRICKYEIELMGGAPFRRYLFILHIGKAAQGAGGGMEHADGTAINIGSGEQLAGVSAHEFFHLWNVKRIRPASLEPIDYTKEQYTRALWFAEGVTSTYGRYSELRSGLWSKQDFYADLSAQINELESRPANRWQSAEQSSLDTWLDKYDYYNGPEFSVSYYTKGQVLGHLLDILIRDRTDNTRSLDDVLRKMNDDFAKQGKFYRDSLDVRLAAEAIAGGSFEEFFTKYVSGTEPFPYEVALAKAGLLFQRQEIQRADLGFRFANDEAGKPTVRSIEPGSSGDRAGLHVGDVLVKFNGDNVPWRPEFWLRRKKPGDPLKLDVIRNEKPVEISFSLGGTSATVFAVSEDPNTSAKARAIREGMLHGTTRKASAAAR